MKRFFAKSLAIFFSLIVVACSSKSDQQPRIRIVDLDGKSHPIATKIPEMNKQAMASQGVFKEQTETFQNNLPPQQDVAQNPVATAPDYGVAAPDEAQKNLSPKNAAMQSNSQQEVAVNAGKQPEEAIEYDLSKPEEDAKPEPKLKETKPVKKSAAAKTEKGLFVQVGSFASASNAKNTLAKMQKFHKGKIETVEGEKTMYRVLLGPFTSKAKAQAMVKKITESGHEAVLMRNK